MWESIVEQDKLRMTIWQTRITCWIPKATNTSSTQWLQERASVLRYVHITCYCAISASTGICLQILLKLLNLNFDENLSVGSDSVPCGHTDGQTWKEAKADSTRALKARQLRRLTKRVATPTEFSNKEIYKNSRSNLDERFWRLQFGVSSASSDPNAVGGVVNAVALNTVQSTLSRLLKRAVQTHV